MVINNVRIEDFATVEPPQPSHFVVGDVFVSILMLVLFVVVFVVIGFATANVGDGIVVTVTTSNGNLASSFSVDPSMESPPE